jgi:pimeloyl-ACP methyl ester carboxylesterase
MFSLISDLVGTYGRIKGKALFLESPEYRETEANWPDVAASLASQFDNPQVETNAFKFDQIIRDRPSQDRQQWKAISVPTLILGNRRDPIHPYDYAQVMAQIIPDAHLEELTPKGISVEQHNADVQRHLERFFLREFKIGL